jgi:organic radical activating enzyme
MMSKIKVAELFYSLQGEGRYVGVPSVFLRTFGCNFQCAGFGMPAGQLSSERDTIANQISKYETYETLPLVRTGCDSYASWDPRFKHLSPVRGSDELANKMLELLPNKEWQDEHLIITGGEPLLGWQKSYPDLLNHESIKDKLKGLTFETNGTQSLSYDLYECLWDFIHFGADYDKLTFSVSAKLPCSGEKWEDAIKPEVIKQYQTIGNTYLKFVVATQEDVEDAKKAVKEYRDAGFTGDVYLMPVGGTDDVYYLNNKQVADYAMRLGWRYSPRLQVDIWRNAWGT